MIAFARYEKSGRILFCGQVPATMLDAQRKEGLIYVGEANAATQYIRDGALQAYTGAELHAKNNLPRGWVWKMPERIAVDPRTQTQRQVDAESTVLAERAANYPPLADLADALYWQSQGDTSKLEAYLAACDAVKRKYPKIK